MNRVIVIIIVFILNSMNIFSQSSLGVCCIYDYQSSILTGNTNYSRMFDNKLQYVRVETEKNTINYTKKNNINDLASSLGRGGDLLVIVHGFGDNIEKVTKKMAHLPELYNIDVLVFSWPARVKSGRGLIQNFDYTKRGIDRTIPMFYSFLNELSVYISKSNRKCSIMFLSLGNTYAKTLGEGVLSKNAPQISFFNNVVLNEACVPSKGHLSWVTPISDNIKGKTYIVSNKYDVVLKLAEQFCDKEHHLGRGYDEGKRGERIVYKDFSEQLKGTITPFESHMFYLGPFQERTHCIYDFYNDVFHNKK